MKGRPLRGFVCFLIGIAIAAVPCRGEPQTAPAESQPPRPFGLGLILDRSEAEALPASATAPPDQPSFVRLTARWEEVENERGVYDWSGLDPAVSHLTSLGFHVALCLTGSNPLYVASGKPPSPLEGSSLDGWVSFVRSAVRSFAGRVRVFEIWDGPSRMDAAGQPAYEPSIYAFVLKNSALAIRAEARASGVEVLVSEGALAAADLDWQKRLWTEDVAAYIDVLPLRIPVAPLGPDVASALSGLFTEAVLHPPAPAIWAYLEPAAGAADRDALAAGVRALCAPAPAAVALFRPPGDEKSLARAVKAALGLDGLLSGFSAAERGELSFQGDGGEPLAGARVLGRLLRERDLTTRIVYDAEAGSRLERKQAWLIVDAAGVKDASVLDPLTGQVLPTIPSRVPGAAGKTALRVLLLDHPMVLSFAKTAAPTGLEIPTEQLQVESTRGLTAEEIIARHQEVQKIQDDRLDRWTAKGRVDFHFKLAQAGSTVDVSIESNYFWARDGHLEWQQTEYYINGNKVRWKKIPELPLIQPEKVITLPLDLTLDKTYVYRLVGEDRVDGRDAYVLAFEPADPNAPMSLYRGRVWIDKREFVRLQASVIQTHLQTPVLSNEERDTYAPVKGPDGGTYWMLARIDGQQLWTAGGRNFVVRRELAFRDVEINPLRPAFEEARRRAYASTDQMLEDTDKGFRYLERQPDGTRTVKEKVDTRQLFAAAGLYKDSSVSGVVPLAGVNYFDYNLGGKDRQFNVLFAGVLAFVNLTDPALFGSRLDLAVEGIGNALKRTDKVFVGDTEQERQRVDFRSQMLSVRLGIPLGQFYKLSLSETYELTSYLRDDKTDPSFALPSDHVLTTAALELELNRRGYTVSVQGSLSGRSKWKPWGSPGGEGQPPAFDPDRKRFSRWQVSAFKEWYLPHFQKLRGEVDLLGGSNLDRFSRYRFTSFGGTSLNGFAGTGVRFDRGAILRGGYSFNLLHVIRLDATVDYARVEEKGSLAGFQNFTGVGLSGNVIGPWKTVIQGSWGHSIQSDIAPLKGKNDFVLFVLKLF